MRARARVVETGEDVVADERQRLAGAALQQREPQREEQLIARALAQALDRARARRSARRATSTGRSASS